MPQPPNLRITGYDGVTDLGLIAKLLVDGLEPQVAAVQIRAQILQGGFLDNSLGISGNDPLAAVTAVGNEAVDKFSSPSFAATFSQYKYCSGPFKAGGLLGYNWVSASTGGHASFNGDHGTADVVGTAAPPNVFGIWNIAPAVPQIEYISSLTTQFEFGHTVFMPALAGNVVQCGLTPTGVTAGAALGAGIGGAFGVAGGVGFEWNAFVSAFYEFVIYDAIGTKILSVPTGVPGGTRVKGRFRRHAGSGLISARLKNATTNFSYGPAPALVGFAAVQLLSSFTQGAGAPGSCVLSLLDKSVQRIVVA